MKKLFAILLLTGTLLACNNHQQAGNKAAIDTADADHDQPGTTAEKLVLNNGAKWKVDISTNNNVRNLQAILEKFSGGSDKSLTAYKKAGDDLQQGLNKMIRECKMKGPDHEALHKWLEPLINLVAKFKQVPDAAAAAQSLDAIREQVDIFPQYFEL